MYHIKHTDNQIPYNKKTFAKKSSIAHHNAPIDYISPWEAQHHLNLIQMQNNQNTQNKAKFTQNKQKVNNVVSLFLQKVRKNSNYRFKDKLMKNFTQQSQQLLTNSNSYASAANSFNNTSLVRKLKKQGLYKNYTSDSPEGKSYPKMSMDAVSDVGFGLLKYNKYNIENQEGCKFYNSSAQRKAQNYGCLSPKKGAVKLINSFSPNNKNQKQQPQVLFLRSRYEDEYSSSINNFKLSNSRRRVFTQEQKSKPQDVVFIKKKKQSNKMAIVDINVTAQQFQDEQIKYIQLNLQKKYGKKAKSRIGKNNRFLTQISATPNQTFHRTSFSRQNKRIKMNKTGFHHSLLKKLE